jgi:MSHA biogenesis protein MshQ
LALVDGTGYNEAVVRSAVLSVLVLVAGCSFNVNGFAPEDGAVGSDDLAVSFDLAMGAPGDMATPPPVGDMAIPPSPSDMAKKGRRKKLTIDIAKVNGNQTDFPVWIDLTDTDIGARAQANGSDIYFTAGDGTTVLDYQIQRWDAGAHRLTAWVRIPSLPANPATSLYVYYGDPSATATPNPPGVFKSSFAAVWHLDDTLPATTIADATGTHAGTASLANTTQTGAKLGGGLAFTGSTDTITFTNPLSGNQAHTISVWVSQANVAHVSAILVLGTPMTDQSRFLYAHFTSAVMGAGYYADDWTTTTGLDNTGFVLVHWVLEGPNGKNHLYVNGAEITGSPMTISGINTQGTAGVIGHAPEPAYGTNTGLLGTIDELRIATTARSAGWIATEYANQSSPSTFYTVGAEEVAP